MKAVILVNVIGIYLSDEINLKLKLILNSQADH